MATNAVNIGKGRASGMFLTAASGTALPSTLTETTLGSWGDVVGFISDEGMTLNLSRDKENIKDWANVVRRVVLTDHEEGASGSCISTTADALTALFGADAVTTATNTTTVNLSASDLPANVPEATTDGPSGCTEHSHDSASGVRSIALP